MNVGPTRELTFRPMKPLPKRQAYDIVFRCRLNGTDWTARLWLRSPDDAFQAMYPRCSGFTTTTGEFKRHGREFYRVVSCTISPDQSRPDL